MDIKRSPAFSKCLLDASSSLPVVPRQRQTLGERTRHPIHATSDPGWRARFPARPPIQISRPCTRPGPGQRGREVDHAALVPETLTIPTGKVLVASSQSLQCVDRTGQTQPCRGTRPTFMHLNRCAPAENEAEVICAGCYR